MRRTFGVVIVAASASVDTAGITDISILECPLTEQGIVNRIGISFDGEYRGSQLLMMLDPDAIYQDSEGGTVAPRELLVGVIPSLANDSFVAQGGTTLETSEGAIVLGGGALGLGGEAEAQWNTAGLNQSWNPAPDVRVEDKTDSLIAQITLSPDALGSWQ